MRSHHLALGFVAAGHLTAAAITAYAGVPGTSTVVLALVGVVAIVLAVIGPSEAAERPRRRTDRHRLGRLESTGDSVDGDLVG